MIRSDSDVSIVTERFIRDLRVAEEERVQREAEKKLAIEREIELYGSQSSGASQGELSVVQTEVAVPQPAPEPHADPEATSRYIRIGVVAVLVVVFFWMWVSQKRSKS